MGEWYKVVVAVVNRESSRVKSVLTGSPVDAPEDLRKDGEIGEKALDSRVGNAHAVSSTRTRPNGDDRWSKQDGGCEALLRRRTIPVVRFDS